MSLIYTVQFYVGIYFYVLVSVCIFLRTGTWGVSSISSWMFPSLLVYPDQGPRHSSNQLPNIQMLGSLQSWTHSGHKGDLFLLSEETFVGYVYDLSKSILKTPKWFTDIFLIHNWHFSLYNLFWVKVWTSDGHQPYHAYCMAPDCNSAKEHNITWNQNHYHLPEPVDLTSLLVL